MVALVRQAAVAGHATAATFATRPGRSAEVMWLALDLRDAERVDAVVAEAAPRLVVDATSGGSDWAVTAACPVRAAGSRAMDYS
ncbi:hypothetical protein [Streptomyces lydicus]|uniref:hypothetical protein n=1 Tax=Streptomyces lydicus TaxID=47763 RepID=UPI00379B6D9D